MGKAMRKPRSAHLKWWFIENDGCWFCKNRNNCNGCKLLKRQKTNEVKKRDRKSKKEVDF